MTSSFSLDWFNPTHYKWTQRLSIISRTQIASIRELRVGFSVQQLPFLQRSPIHATRSPWLDIFKRILYVAHSLNVTGNFLQLLFLWNSRWTNIFFDVIRFYCNECTLSISMIILFSTIWTINQLQGSSRNSYQWL